MDKDYQKLNKIENIDLFLKKLARIDCINSVSKFSDRAASFSISEIDFSLIINESIDLSMELIRIQKEESKISDDIVILQKKLDNKSFTEKAPKKIVQESFDRLNQLSLNLTKVRESKKFIKKFVSDE